MLQNFKFTMHLVKASVAALNGQTKNFIERVQFTANCISDFMYVFFTFQYT